MNPVFRLAEPLALDDLGVYLARAARVENGAVRVLGTSGVLAVYSAVLYPAGLLDTVPTVLGLRTFALAEPVDIDAVVPIRSLAERVERAKDTDGSVTLPTEVASVTWAGITPPRGGWKRVGETTAGVLRRAGDAGVQEVAAAVPTGTGEQLVHRVRAEVWGRPIPDLEHVAAGAGFAALSLGFLGSDDTETVPLFETAPWSRLSSPRGHVLVRRRSWSLLGS